MKRGRISALVAAACVAGALGLAILIVEATIPASLAANATQEQPEPSVCEAAMDKVAWPFEVPFGTSASVTLTARVRCPDETQAVHMAIVIDQSLTEEELRDAKNSAIRSLSQLGLEGRPMSRVAVIGFGSSARRVCDLTHDEDEIEACINRLRTSTGTRIDLGINQAASTLRRARGDIEPWREINEPIHLYTDGEPDDHCSAAGRQAASASRSGMYTQPYCVGSDCNSECMNEIRDGTRSGGAKRPRLRPPLIHPAILTSLTLTDTMASNMRLVLGSVRPTPHTVGEGGRQLIWHPNSQPITLSYELEPLEMGDWPTNQEAKARYSVSRHGARVVLLPVPTIRVIEGPGFPTPSATVTREPTDAPSLTPTAEATRTATRSPLATETVTATPTGEGERYHLYLPATVLEANPGER